MDPECKSGALLLYAPVPLHQTDGEVFVERQAVNGLRRWAEHFPGVTVMMPLDRSAPPEGWLPLSEVAHHLERVRLEPLPMAYRPDQFIRHLPATRAHIRTLIAGSQYLSFAIGGLFGDWGAVACLEADRMGRPFAVWTDRVESEVVRRTARDAGMRRRLSSGLIHRPMSWLERKVISKAALGLFHGRETFDAYAPYCRNPQIVHDIHLDRREHVPPEMLEAKISGVANAPLSLCYVGRADSMKGPFDWIEVLTRLSAAGTDFTATWLGGGALLDEMRARILRAGLQDKVSMPGFVDDRAKVLETLRGSHVFLFCHKTPESPRNLIEALASGCPLVGYGGAFAQDLISGHGGGVLVPVGDIAALTGRIIALDRDRNRLADLIRNAVRDGEPFTDEAVFRHRSDLIKTHLSAGPARAALQPIS